MIERKSEMEEEIKHFYECLTSMSHWVGSKNSINDSNVDHTFDMSSIIQRPEEEDLIVENYDDETLLDADIEVRKIEESLKHLVTKGFFSKENEQHLAQFYSISQRFSWKELTHQPFYSAML